MPFKFDWGTPAFAGPDMMGTAGPGYGGGISMPGMPMATTFDTSGLPNLGAPGAVTTPGLPGGINGQVFGGKLGMNLPTAQLALSGIGTLGSLWGAFQAASLAKKQFGYTRDVTETNLANSLKTYNTGLTDRANNRAIVEGRSAAETQAYIDANKLSRYGR